MTDDLYQELVGRYRWLSVESKYGLPLALAILQVLTCAAFGLEMQVQVGKSNTSCWPWICRSYRSGTRCVKPFLAAITFNCKLSGGGTPDPATHGIVTEWETPVQCFAKAA